MRASKDTARRLRFDRYPRPDFFRRRFFLLGVAALVVGIGLWAGFAQLLGERQYLPGPVSRNHATFGDRCETCHATFRDVPNTTCLECHAERVHSDFETSSVPCAECHVEHRDVEVFLDVSSSKCVQCHGELETRRPKPLLHAAVRSFADHPPFAPLRPGASDPAAIRFNHALHLTSDKVLPADKLQCASCHLPDGDGRRIRPISFEQHCERCHKQDVTMDFGTVRVPHRSADLRKDGLTAIAVAVELELAVLGVADGERIFKGVERLIPGQAQQGAADQSRSLREFQSVRRPQIEQALYKPFEQREPLLESNKYCLLCHIEDGERAAGDPPKLKESGIPARWLQRGEFSHRKHDVLACAHCHPGVEPRPGQAGSKLTSDVNLPKKEVCAACHTEEEGRTAGNDCMLCHLYHDTSKDPSLREKRRKVVPLDLLLGRH